MGNQIALPDKCARENGRTTSSQEEDAMFIPLFLGGRTLLGCGLGRRCGLGDSARLGLAEDLGLLNYRRRLEQQKLVN